MTFQVHAIDLPILTTRSRFEAANRVAIDAQWEEEVKANPRLWNGEQFLFEDVRVEEGVLRGIGYRTDFATFLYWRRNRYSSTAMPTHIAATTLPVTSDGALLTIRMAPHTANPGEYYFPAGSLDDHDVIDGHISIDANIRRELLEETGIAYPLAEQPEPYIVAIVDNAWHIARRFDLPLSVDQARDAIAQHQAATGDDETDAVEGIYKPEQTAKLKPYARLLAEWHFDNMQAGRAA